MAEILQRLTIPSRMVHSCKCSVKVWRILAIPRVRSLEVFWMVISCRIAAWSNILGFVKLTKSYPQWRQDYWRHFFTGDWHKKTSLVRQASVPRRRGCWFEIVLTSVLADKSRCCFSGFVVAKVSSYCIVCGFVFVALTFPHALLPALPAPTKYSPRCVQPNMPTYIARK